jgi:hypothetical protein
MPEPKQPDETDPTEAVPTETEPADVEATDQPDGPQQDAPATARDKWWWSPAVALVMGVVIVTLRWSSLTGTGGNLLNWVVAGLGAAVAVSGVVRLVRDYPR